MKILVTAFDAFGNDDLNSSQEVLKQLPNRLNGHTLVKVLLATQVDAALSTLDQVIQDHQPHAIIQLGQATGRSTITMERVAINTLDFTIPDNAGYHPQDTFIVEKGPAAYFLTLPNKAMIKACLEANIPASISNTAGTYVCNAVAYYVAHKIVIEDLKIRSGFIHLPILPNQSKNHPSLPLETLLTGIQICLEVVVDELSH